MQTGKIKVLQPGEVTQKFKKYDWDLVTDGKWRTAREIAEILGCPVRYVYSRLNRAWRTGQKVNDLEVQKGITPDGRIVFRLA